MIRTGEEREVGSERGSDRLIWQRCRMIDAPEDEAARHLDLAAFADGLPDEDEHARVAALLATDPDLAADVGAARALVGADLAPDALERIVARATAVLSDAAAARGNVVAFAPRPGRRVVRIFAQWGSVAAALVVASWLGFAMGTDASLALSEPRQPSDAGFLPELFDPPAGLLRDLGEGQRT